MKYSASHVFPCSPEALMDALDEEALEQRLAVVANMSREVLEVSTAGRIRTKRVRCRPNREIPGFVKKLIGERGLEYEEVNKTNLDTGVVHWNVTLPVMNDRVTIGGITRITAHPDGAQRAMQGEFSVRVPLVGGRIEKITVADIRKSYDEASEAVRAYVIERESAG